MSETEPERVASAPAEEPEVRAAPPARPGVMRRVLNWYTCRPEREQVRRSVPVAPRQVELLRRAKAALATGNLLREPSDPARKSLAGAHAASLYAESLTWALWSVAPGSDRPRAEALFQEDESVVRELALPAERASQVTELLGSPSLALDLAERPEDEQEDAAALLKRAALVAIDVHERPLRAADGLTLISIARVAVTIVGFALLVGGAIALKPQKQNLAAGKAWKASSSLFDCHPEQAECGGAKTRIFFHTRDEQDPWLQYDLGAPTAFSSVRVDNRQDGEGARAVPLVVEVGDDGQHFRQVARRDDDFSSWSASFPSVTARYVRLRVARKSMLHLEEVDVYR